MSAGQPGRAPGALRSRRSARCARRADAVGIASAGPRVEYVIVTGGSVMELPGTVRVFLRVLPACTRKKGIVLAGIMESMEVRELKRQLSQESPSAAAATRPSTCRCPYRCHWYYDCSPLPSVESAETEDSMCEHTHPSPLVLTDALPPTCWA